MVEFCWAGDAGAVAFGLAKFSGLRIPVPGRRPCWTVLPAAPQASRTSMFLRVRALFIGVPNCGLAGTLGKASVGAGGDPKVTDSAGFAAGDANPKGLWKTRRRFGSGSEESEGFWAAKAKPATGVERFAKTPSGRCP